MFDTERSTGGQPPTMRRRQVSSGGTNEAPHPPIDGEDGLHLITVRPLGRGAAAIGRLLLKICVPGESMS
jgi:hypothetical protein